MEESENRRERLRAMRAEASEAGASSRIGSEVHQLSNPLIESVVTPRMQMRSPGTPRFDYYTDPMAAFSNDNRMSNSSYQNPPGSSIRFPAPMNPPSPAHQVQPTYSPDPRMNQPRSPYYSSGPMRPEANPSPAHHVRPPYSPEPRMFQPQNSYYSSRPMNPEMTYSPAHHVQQPPYSLNPRMHQQHRGSYYNSGPRNPSMSPTPIPAQGQSGHFQARGSYQSSYANMRSPGSRGTPTAAGSGYGNSPSSGRGRGRGRGFGSHGSSVSAEVRPDLYYKKSMVEDPWKNLEPSVWKIVAISVKGSLTPNSRTYSHSDSFGTKKARISEASEEPGSQPSLAAYLAAAFNETVGEEGNKE